MCQIVTKFFPSLLTEGQENHVNVCQDFKEMLESDPQFVSKVITGAEEMWVYRYDPETKQQSSHWKSRSYPHPTPQKKKKRKDRKKDRFTQMWRVCSSFLRPSWSSAL
jgi:hypothetical protein